MTWWYEDGLTILDYDKDKGWHYRHVKEKKMEFDKSRVYTALNADELRAGDKVIVADQLSVLKQRVQEGKENSAIVLQRINGEDWGRRFGFTMYDFALAYLVERAENCTNCKYSNPHKNLLYCEDDNIPIYVGGEKLSVCDKYKPKTEQKAEKKCEDCTLDEICVEGKKIYKDAPCPYHRAKKHYRPFKDVDELIEEWDKKLGYRDPTGLAKPYIWVRYKNLPDSKGMLINGFENNIVYVMYADRSMQELFDNFEFLDGTPCGVEE